MEYKHYWTFKNIGSSYIKEQELIKEKFSSYQVNEFSAWECFDKSLFKTDYPNDPGYRDFIINLFLNVIDSTRNLSPIPFESSNENPSKKTSKKIAEVIKSLNKSLLLIDHLPAAFKNMSSRNGIEYKDIIKFYKNEMIFCETELSVMNKNEILLDRIFIAFNSGFGIKEYKSVTSMPLIYEIIMIFTGLDDLESARKIINRYKKNLIQRNRRTMPKLN